MLNKYYFPLALLVTLLSLGARAWLSAPPPLVPASAPQTVFSGERAVNLLREMLRESDAHPIGSAENQRVRQRIEQWLTAQAIDFEVQRAWGCDAQGDYSCAWVENIVATIPGRDAGPYLALMAHYDSVPAGPGAGDDMAGVVAVLETARAMKASGVTRKPLLLLITDGEETGLHGAEAFFSQHPLAREIGVLLNVEGSGTRGASAVLRTSSPNSWFMQAFAEGAAYPRGSSFAAEVFKRMPNDTDFSVVARAGVAGMDFAFAAERVHYHTPRDNPQMLDPHTVQHHGENLLPLARALADSSLVAPVGATAGDDVVFQDLFGHWIQWPAQYSWLLFAVAVGLLMLDSLSMRGQRGRVVLAATLVPALTLACAIGAGYGASRGLDHFNGLTVDWPAHLWAHRLAIGASSVLAVCLFSALFCRRLPAAIVLLGAWWFVAFLVLLLLVFLSKAAGVYLVMLLPAAALLCVASWVPMSEFFKRLLRALTLIPGIVLLGAALQSEDALGFVLILASLPFLGLYLVLALAFLRGSGLLLLGAVSALAMVVGGVAATTLPLYSDYRPQHLNVWHYEDADAQTAHWRLRTDGPIPQSMQAVTDFRQEPKVLLPWSDAPLDHLAAAAYEGLAPPVLTLVDTKVSKAGGAGGEEREVTLRLASQRGAWAMGLVLPAEARLKSARVGTQTLLGTPHTDPSGASTLWFYGVQSTAVPLTLTLGSSDPVQGYLLDQATRLPVEGVRNARPMEAVPVHSGDISLLWHRVSF